MSKNIMFDKSMKKVQVHLAEEICANYSTKTIVLAAKLILESKLKTKGALTSPRLVEDYLKMVLFDRDDEYFVCIYLDNKNQVIVHEVLFIGTVDQVSVYPRTVVKRCLHHNASAVVLAHNHPSLVCEPSQSDIKITNDLVSVLKHIGVRVLDHIIVGGPNTVSLAERGYV